VSIVLFRFELHYLSYFRVAREQWHKFIFNLNLCRFSS